MVMSTPSTMKEMFLSSNQTFEPGTAMAGLYPFSTAYSYHTAWSGDDRKYVGLCAEFPSLASLAGTRDQALAGIERMVLGLVGDMIAIGESPPLPLSHPNRALG
jgi:predicted RNase H-like HicB family nuclease